MGPTGLRRGFDGPHGMERQRSQADPHLDHLFLFCSRTQTRLKVLF
ncbi:IS66 family insertion sequence element accessory protein TnpB [Verrucomicrobiota bacterium sgz303538]